MQARPNVYFNFPNDYNDSAIGPRVGVVNGTVVAIHHTPPHQNIYYHVGKLTGGLVDFPSGSARRYRSPGWEPAVAVNTVEERDTVVVVHAANEWGSSVPGLYCSVGEVDAQNERVDFGEVIKYDNGTRPQVALNKKGVVVTVHESRAGSSQRQFRIGRVDPINKTVSFSPGRLTAEEGFTSSIAIDDENRIIEVYRWRAQQGPFHLWYRVGLVDPDRNTITFGDRNWYDTGVVPAVALNDDGFVISVHQSEIDSSLWSRVGRLDFAPRRIPWFGGSFQYHRGGGTAAPAVAVTGSLRNGAVAVQVNNRLAAAQCAASMLIDRTSWMADNLDLIGNKKLREIAIPASHDAGMSQVQHCSSIFVGSCQTQTQNHPISGQLLFGCRYFDIRPVIHSDGQMYTGHFNGSLGCAGQSILTVLLSVLDYYLENPQRARGRDLVILKFSHYSHPGQDRGFTDDEMRTLLQLVTSRLGDRLFKQEVPTGGLQSVTLNDYLDGGGKVLAVFDKLPDSMRDPRQGIYKYVDKKDADAGVEGDLIVFDEYAGTNELQDMIKNQLEKLRSPANHGTNLFLLSWTLTQDKWQAIGCPTGHKPSVLDLAREANEALWKTLVSAQERGDITPARMPNLVYTDDIQSSQTDFALWLNQKILGSR